MDGPTRWAAWWSNPRYVRAGPWAGATYNGDHHPCTASTPQCLRRWCAIRCATTRTPAARRAGGRALRRAGHAGEPGVLPPADGEIALFQDLVGPYELTTSSSLWSCATAMRALQDYRLALIAFEGCTGGCGLQVAAGILPPLFLVAQFKHPVCRTAPRWSGGQSRPEWGPAAQRRTQPPVAGGAGSIHGQENKL